MYWWHHLTSWASVTHCEHMISVTVRMSDAQGYVPSSVSFRLWPFWKVWWHPRPRAPDGQWRCCCRGRWEWRGPCSPAWSGPRPSTSSSLWTTDCGPFWNSQVKKDFVSVYLLLPCHHFPKRKTLIRLMSNFFKAVCWPIRLQHSDHAVSFIQVRSRKEVVLKPWIRKNW